MIWHFFGAHAVCGAIPIGPGLLVSMFLAGLTGSALHCGPMCGPFVLGQVGENLARIPAARLCGLTRLRGALLAPYHAGRLLTYAGLGASAASFGGFASPTKSWPAMLLATAGGLCALAAAQRIWPRLARRPAPQALPGLSRIIVRLGQAIDRTRLSGGFLLGLLLGFLPCGLLYAALVVAAASPSALLGASAMAAFGLGTVPALIGIGLAGHAAGRGRFRLTGRAGGAILLFNAGLLWALAGQALLS